MLREGFDGLAQLITPIMLIAIFMLGQGLKRIAEAA